MSVSMVVTVPKKNQRDLSSCDPECTDGNVWITMASLKPFSTIGKHIGIIRIKHF